ncbi:MAG: hypothetical protein HQ492_02555 [Woeseiaceae bacterium]|nr:hypothetical protein [Woeseiaceae bacterium]
MNAKLLFDSIQKEIGHITAETSDDTHVVTFHCALASPIIVSGVRLLEGSCVIIEGNTCDQDSVFAIVHPENGPLQFVARRLLEHESPREIGFHTIAPSLGSSPKEN